MVERSNLKSLSKAIEAPLTAAHRAGGLALTFLTLGTILMLVAFFASDRAPLTYAVFFTGVGLIATTLTYFYFKAMHKLIAARESVKKNKELIDSIQQAAWEMTELAYTLQSLTFKQADQITIAIQSVRPIIKDLPIAGTLAESQAITKAEIFLASVVEITERVRGNIKDVERALVESDPKSLKRCLVQIAEYRNEVKKLLTLPPTHYNIAQIEAGEETAAEFHRLAAAWRKTRNSLSSRVNEVIANDSYQQIVALGWPAVPFIIRELEQELKSAEGPDFWFPALKIITGEDPVPASSRGQLERMAEAWLDWGNKKGYCRREHVTSANLS